MNKKGIEMAWSQIAWYIIGITCLLILIYIVYKGASTGTNAVNIFDSIF